MENTGNETKAVKIGQAVDVLQLIRQEALYQAVTNNQNPTVPELGETFYWKQMDGGLKRWIPHQITTDQQNWRIVTCFFASQVGKQDILNTDWDRRLEVDYVP